MQDGQNVLSSAKKSSTTWRVDEKMMRLAVSKRAIIVAIDHGGIERIREYSPYNRGRCRGLAEDYLGWIVHRIKPEIDARYPTLPQPESSWLVGSSMGGLLALYGGLRYSHVFKRIGALSPSLWWSPAIWQEMPNPSILGSRWYVSGSATESSTMSAYLQKFYWRLRHLGVPDSHLTVAIRDRGRHHEVFWAREFGKMYSALYQ
jgi:predicted alpha/beta superfamily hydrolase